MILTPNNPVSRTIKVFKDGEDITFRCFKVNTKTKVAWCYIRPFVIEKERLKTEKVENVTVLLNFS